MPRLEGDVPGSPLAAFSSATGKRREQLAAFINLIAAQGPVSRGQAMSHLGWSRTAITRVATTLLDAGVISEATPTFRAGRGRPTSVLRLSVGPAVTIGIDLGFRSVRTILAGVDHTILAAREQELTDAYGPAEAFTVARELIDDSLETAERTWTDVIGIGLGISGPIDYDRNAPSLKSLLPLWEGDVVDRARAYLPGQITLGNDTRLACYAELIWGAGRKYDDFVYLKLHSGVGGAYVQGRHLVNGANGAAGELGHMVVDPQGEICRCGGRGCLETVVGVPAILRDLTAAYGRTPEWAEAVAALDTREPSAIRAFDSAYEVIGRAAASLCNILNPQAIILGGALTRSSEQIADVVADGIRRNALPVCNETPVLIGELGRSAAALGAVGAVLMQGIV